MRQKKLGIGGWAFLGGTVIFCASGCPPNIIPSGLPSNDPNEGRQLVVFEGDIQDTAEQYLSYGITPGCTGTPAGTVITPLQDLDGRLPPFDITVRGELNPDGGASEWYLDFKDNEIPFADGEKWSIRIDGVDVNGLRTESEGVVATYRKGHSPEWLTNRLEQIGDITNTGDGEDLYDALKQSYVKVVDSAGNVLDPMAQEEGRARLWYHTTLETAVGPPVGFDVRDLGYNGSGDCFNVETTGPMERVGEEGEFALYDVPIRLQRTPGCAQKVELIESRYGVDIGGGDVEQVTNQTNAILTD